MRLGGAPLGYAEAKDVGVPLDAETEQIRRYRDGLRNLLFTDGLTFTCDGRVFLNAEQFVGGVEPEVWAHAVGGYQPLEKWLKDRRGRALTYADLTHYARVVSALRETQRLMGEAEDAAEALGW